MHALRILVLRTKILQTHDDVIKWKHFPRYWPFLRRIHRSPVNFPHKGQWRGALMFSLIWTWINSWVNNPEAGDLRRHRAHCDVSVMNILSRRLYNSFKGDIYLLSILWYYWQDHTINNYKWNNSGWMKFDEIITYANFIKLQFLEWNENISWVWIDQTQAPNTVHSICVMKKCTPIFALGFCQMGPNFYTRFSLRTKGMDYIPVTWHWVIRFTQRYHVRLNNWPLEDVDVILN